MRTSHGGTPTRKNSSSSSPSFPAYLYRRGDIFYFRLRIPTGKQGKGVPSEFRISLRTSYVRKANSLARHIYSELQALLQRGVDYQTIRKRLNGLLRVLLEKNNRQPDSPIVDVSGIDEISHEEYSLRLFQNTHQLLLKSKKNLEWNINKIIHLLIYSGLFTEKELAKDEDKILATKCYMKMMAMFSSLFKTREFGKYEFDEHFWKEGLIGRKQNFYDIEQEKIKRYLLSETIENYITTKVSDGAWKEHVIQEHKGRLSFALDILGDRYIDSINRKDIREFRDKLCKLPPHRFNRKEYKGKSVDEIIAMNPHKRLSVTRINIIIEAISSLFEWCINEGILYSHNPAKGLQIKDERSVIEFREPFSVDDLNKIFLSDAFKDKRRVNEAYYWCPLISLYSGMRLEEISQLSVDDVYFVDGIWVFDVNANPSRDGRNDKQVKNKNAVRIVPMHNKLIDLGFIEYVDSIKIKGEERLFYKLNKTERSPRYGKQVGKNFSDIIKICGIKGKKSFHSLRHTFSDFYKKRHLQNDVFRQVFGHDIPELAAKQYGSKFTPKQCFDEVISQLEYEIYV